METIAKLLHGQSLFSTALLITAVTSIVTAIVKPLREAPGQLWEKIKNRFVFSAMIYQYDDLFYDFESWFFAHYKERYRHVEASTSLKSTERGELPIRENGVQEIERQIFYKQNAGTFFIRFQGKMLLIEKGKDKLNNAQDAKSVFFNHYTISGFKAKAIIDDLLKEVILFSSKDADPQEVNINTNSYYGNWDRSNVLKAKPLDRIVINSKIKIDLLADFERFKVDRDWYTKTSILYKRGYLFYGPPGNGKLLLLLLSLLS